MIDLADVTRDAATLEAGPPPSVKLALWWGMLSANESLAMTCKQAARLRRYAHRALPDEATLRRLLAGTGMYGVKWHGLYHIEGCEQAGLLRGLPVGYAAQVAWREQMYGLCHGHGMARKTISMAGLLLCPTACELVPIDRHVLARLGLWERYARSKRNYLEVEAYVRDERDRSGLAVSAAIWHWLQWARWIAAKYPNRTTLESHCDLTCRG